MEPAVSTQASKLHAIVTCPTSKELGTNQGGDSIHFLHQLGSPLRATGGRVSYYPVHAFMGSLPRVTSRNGILTFTITDLHLLDTQCHTCCMAQCNDLLQPMSIISAASMTAPAASTAVTTAAMTQTVVTASATANIAFFKLGTMVTVCSPIWA